jgi:ABC-type microcin C transport system duplicated ATPase subunit YejF
MIFQEPIASLNPCFTVGFQIEEVLAQASWAGQGHAASGPIELFHQVGIKDPEPNGSTTSRTRCPAASASAS